MVSELSGTLRLWNIPQVLLKAHLNIVHQLLRRAKLTVNAHVDQHRLQCRKTEHDTRGQPASQHGECDLCNTFDRADLVSRHGMQRMMSVVLLRSLFRRMGSIIGDPSAYRSDSTAMMVELTILPVNRSDAMDEGHMALSCSGCETGGMLDGGD